MAKEMELGIYEDGMGGREREEGWEREGRKGEMRGWKGGKELKDIEGHGKKRKGREERREEIKVGKTTRKGINVKEE